MSCTGLLNSSSVNSGKVDCHPPNSDGVGGWTTFFLFLPLLLGRGDFKFKLFSVVELAASRYAERALDMMEN